MVIAHAKWFIEDSARYTPEWGNLVDPATLALLVGVALAVALVGPAQRRVPTGLLPSVSVSPRLTAAVPRLLAASLGLALPLLAAHDRLLFPTASLNGVPGASMLAVTEATLGLWLLTGWRLQRAAAALGVLCAVVAVTHGPLALLEGAYVPAIAVYLALMCAPGDSDQGRRSLASSTLAVALGGSLILVAFTEKLLVPDLGLAVVHAHPSLDVLATAGVHMPDGAFVRFAGAGEVLLGLLILTGIGGRAVPLGALLPFIATVSIFGGEELVGHLPIYGALVAVAARPSALSSATVPTRLRRPRARAGIDVAVDSAAA